MIVAGCTADAGLSLRHVVAYAHEVLGLEAPTGQVLAFEQSTPKEGCLGSGYSIVRMRSGKIRAGAAFHRIDAKGLVVGLAPSDVCCACDVDPDVSRRHARLWQEEGRLFIIDLNSENGTRIVSATTGTCTQVAPPNTNREESFVPQALELRYGDVICLGSTTRYIVLPEVDSS